MPNNTLTLAEAYANASVQTFGKALRAALTFQQDYASLMDFENAEKPEAFAEAVSKLLRRNQSKERWPKPTAADVEHLMALARSEADIRILRTAIISYGLAQWDKKEEKP